jgi:elongation factor G
MRATSHRPENIRNIVLLGHGGSGKTTLAEAILLKCGVISRMGSVEQASTTSDFEPEARAHRQSTNSTLLFGDFEGREINIVDTPGHPEFVGSALAALPAADTALIVVNASTGIEFNTRRLFHAAGEAGLARMFVVNRIDTNPQGLGALLANLKSTFGAKIHAMNLPSGGATDVVDCFDQESGQTDFGSVEEVHRELLESAVEVDDAELERYLSGEKIDLAALRKTFVRAMAVGHVVPVVFTSSRNVVGVEDLLHIIVNEAPSPVSGRPRRLVRNGELVEIPCDVEKPLLAQVFKVTNDAHLGQMAMLRVLQGKLDANTPFVCAQDKKARKAGHVLKVEGRDHPEITPAAFAGDIVALGRVEDIHVDQLLHEPGRDEDLSVPKQKYPAPMLSLAVESKNRGDDVKIGQALSRIVEEDPTFSYSHDPETHELILTGIGDVHLNVMIERLKNRFKLEVSTKPPTIPYRECIGQKAEGHHRHKKQTGGAGQFGEVFLRIEPLPRGTGFEFKSEVFGGAIPTQYIPAVEKGARDALESGVLAGFPVQDVRVVVTDGKSHPVDSKDIAFRTAGKMAVRDAMAKARPALLEPVVNLEVTAPEEYTGTITSEMKQIRGRVLGMENLPGGVGVVRAQAPLAELGSYGGTLRGSTGGQGSFVIEMSHYDPVPPHIHTKIVEARAGHRKKDDE